MPFTLSESELKKTEDEIGAVFPDSYRQSMMQANGGTIAIDDDDWELFPIHDQSSNKVASRTCNHVLYKTKQAQQWKTFHENAFAIAHNGAGDKLVIFRKGEQFERGVFIWRHEDGALEFTANDFADIKRV